MDSSLELPLKITQKQQLPCTVASHLLGIAHHRRHHNNSFNTLRRCASLVFKVALI